MKSFYADSVFFADDLLLEGRPRTGMEKMGSSAFIKTASEIVHENTLPRWALGHADGVDDLARSVPRRLSFLGYADVAGALMVVTASVGYDLDANRSERWYKALQHP